MHFYNSDRHNCIDIHNSKLNIGTYFQGPSYDFALLDCAGFLQIGSLSKCWRDAGCFSWLYARQCYPISSFRRSSGQHPLTPCMFLFCFSFFCFLFFVENDLINYFLSENTFPSNNTEERYCHSREYNADLCTAGCLKACRWCCRSKTLQGQSAVILTQTSHPLWLHKCLR